VIGTSRKLIERFTCQSISLVISVLRPSARVRNRWHKPLPLRPSTAAYWRRQGSTAVKTSLRILLAEVPLIARD
jgi:hypothetical protein